MIVQLTTDNSANFRLIA